VADAPAGIREGVVAIVNDDIISSYDLSQRTLLLLVTSGVRPTRDNVPQFQQEALRGLVDERLEVAEIRREEKEQKFTIMADDDEVNEEIDRMAQANRMNSSQLLASLGSAGVDPATLRDQIRARISWSHWIGGRYGGSRLKVSETQVNSALQALEAEEAKPQYEISEIFIDATRAGGMDQAKAGAQQLIGQIQQGAPFGAVARQFSAASTAANGGDAGWMSESQLQPEVRAAVEQMRLGQLSDPIVAQDGVYVVQLRDKRSGANSVVVDLKQAAVNLAPDAPAEQVAAAQQTLLAIKAKATGCADFEATAGKSKDVVAGDLGETDLKDLAPTFQDAIKPLKVDQISDPVRTAAGLHLIALCGRHLGGVQLPSREEIEARLEDQTLSGIARRVLRDLRSSATIDVR
jgi:peptidyl-prolyl cis-trans isomerase SurA